MDNFVRGMKNGDGSIDTLNISSNDNNYPLDINKTYKLVNNSYKVENKIFNAYKNSVFGCEIGVKTEGFTNIAILATLVAVGMFCIMLITFRI